MRGDRFSSPLRERLPDELRDVVFDVGPAPVAARSYLAGERAHDVVQPAVPFVVADMRDAANELAHSTRGGPRVSVPCQEHRRAAGCLKDAAKVCQEGVVGPPPRVVRAAEAPRQAPPSAIRKLRPSVPAGPASSTLHASGVVNVARYKGSRRIVSAGREPGHGRGQSLPRPDRRERPARADGPAEHAPGVGVDRVQESAVTA
jgi:hypothetical protein